MERARHARGGVLRVAGLALVAGALLAGGGCAIVGAVAENYRKDATRKVDAETDVLAGKSFALLVSAPRSVQGDFPTLVETLTARCTERLSNPANVPAAGGFVPPVDVLRFMYNTPAWSLRSKTELGKALGDVDRLVMVEVSEFRLHAPGNPYVWDGVASALVSVYDPRSRTPEIALFERTVLVKFPDKQGDGPEQMAAALVNSALLARLVDRATWLFYDHQEPYYPTY